MLFRAGFDRDNIIAVIMAIIATFAATTTFTASLLESRASACGRMLEQAEHFELARSQSYVERYYAHGRWKADDDLRKGLARALLEGTPGLNGADVQIEYATARAIKPVEDFTDPHLDPTLGLDDAVAARAQQDVRDLGIRNRCAGSEDERRTAPHGKQRDYLAPLRHDLDVLRTHLVDEERAALYLLIALALFAMADIVPSAPAPAPAASAAEQPSGEPHPAAPPAPGAAITVPAPVLRAEAPFWTVIRWLADIGSLVAAAAAVLYTLYWVDGSLWIPFTVFAGGVLAVGVLLGSYHYHRDATRAWLATKWLTMCWYGRFPASCALSRRPAGDPVGVPGEPGHTDHELVYEGTNETRSRLQHHRRGHIDTPFKRVLVFLIALTAVVTASSEYSHGLDSATSDDAAQKAVSEQIELLRTGTPSESAAFDAIRRMVIAREALLRAYAFRGLRDTAMERKTAVEAAVWKREADRWSTIWNLITTEPPLTRATFGTQSLSEMVAGADGPYADLSFPRRYFVHGTVFGPAQQLALWDARDAERAAYEQRASFALGTITLFGIALYLFGQSLGMGRSQGGYVLATFGAGVLIAGFTLGMRGAHLSVPTDTKDPARPIWACHPQPGRGEPSIPGQANDTRASAAAVCYALAEVRARLARTPDENAVALQQYENATRERPGFALADFGAARTASKLWTPQSNTLHISIVDVAHLKKLTDVDRRVYDDLALRDLNAPVQLLENSNLHDYLQAVVNRSRPALDAMIDRTVEAIELETDRDARTLLRYRKAVALLAAGRNDKVDSAYFEAFRDLNPADAEANDVGAAAERERAEVAGAAISDLEFLRAHCSELRWLQHDCARLVVTGGDIDSRKEHIVCQTWKRRCSGTRRSLQRDVAVAWSLGGVAWRTPATSSAKLPAGRTVMVVYRRETAVKSASAIEPWYVLPQLSYPVDPSRVESSSRWTRLTRSLLTGSGYTDCLQTNAEYRIELYADGALAAEALFPAARGVLRNDHFAAAALRDPGVGLCYPDDWKRDAARDGELRDGLRSSDGTQGAFGFAFLAPGTLSHEQLIAQKRSAVDRAVRETLAHLPHGSSLPIGSKTLGHCSTYFEDRVAYDEYVAGPFAVRAKVWDADGGLISVGVVWNRVRPAPGDDRSCSILGSMTKIESDASNAARRTPTAEPARLTHPG